MLLIINKQIPSCCVRCSIKKSDHILLIKKLYYIQDRIHVERRQCILKNQSLNQGAKNFLNLPFGQAEARIY